LFIWLNEMVQIIARQKRFASKRVKNAYRTQNRLVFCRKNETK